MAIRIELEDTVDCINNVVKTTKKNVFIENNKFIIEKYKFNFGSTLVKNDDDELFVREDDRDWKLIFD